MTKKTCGSCFKNKTSLRCSDCEDLSCKSCSIFVDEYEFEYMAQFSQDLLDKVFCPSCYNQKVSDQIQKYNEALVLAKNINVYDKDQGSETGIIKKIEKPIHVKDCEGEKEALMKLAFLAAMKGYDTIIDTHLVAEKVSRGGKYRTHLWRGSAVPVDPKIRK